MLPLAMMSLMFDGCVVGQLLHFAVALNREWKAPVSTRNSWLNMMTVIKKPKFSEASV